MSEAGTRLREGFMAWQCLIRQHAMRRHGGRPSDGMEPLASAAGESLGHIRTVIVKREPRHSTARFRHIVERTHDPRERFDEALRYLQASYFQRPRSFEPRLFALFAPASPGAARLAQGRACTLDFRQFARSFCLPCRVARLAADDPFTQALFWHNAMFNPALPPGGTALAFAPRWEEGSASPPPDEGVSRRAWRA